MSPYLPPWSFHQSIPSLATKLSSSLAPMANKQIVPYGFDLNKKPDALALSVVPP
jgi:hypothetical protein